MNESDGRLISGEGESCPDKSENDLKALQSVGQIVGEVLSQLTEEEFIVKATNGRRYVVGCRRQLEKAKLKPGTRVALDMTTRTIMRYLPREVDPLVYNMPHEDPGDVTYSGIGGSAAEYNQQTLQSGPDGEREEILTSLESQEDNCNECEEESLEMARESNDVDALEIETSFKSSLFEPKELEASSGGEGGARHKQGSRSNIEEEMTLARECAGCGKDIKKRKIQLMCACKETIYCSEDCQKSSDHKCNEVNTLNGEWENKIYQATIDRYYRERAAGRGPTSDRIKELAENIEKDKGCLLSLAKDGHTIAAYLIGTAYLEGRVKKDRESDQTETEVIRCGKDYMWFGMPPKDVKKSRPEKIEISIKWLKQAAEGGVPESMFLLGVALLQDCGLEVDKRVADYWLDRAYRTGKMEYLIESLVYGGIGMARDFKLISLLTYSDNKADTGDLVSIGLGQLLLAARWEELKSWDGKTSKGEEFYGWAHFNKSVEKVGGLVDTENLKVVYSRPGGVDAVRHVVSKERKESNIKFKQGTVKMEANPDFQLIQKATFSSKDRTAYLVTCKHDEFLAPENAKQIEKIKGVACQKYIDKTKCFKFKKAGECQLCAQDALQRLRSVDEGQYSISITQVIPKFGHAARYVTENGTIIQDIFMSYSKPDLRQVLQCLMSNPADLHPLAVAEDATLYWGIIWYWGSVYHAVQDTCNRSTLDKIFGKRFSVKSGNSAESGNENVSGLEAFPESAAGEWRFACGNEACNKVDHKVKFMVCGGCAVRRYCGEVCQGKDWDKHKKFCKAAN